MNSEILRRRLIIFGLIIIFAFLVLISKLFSMQLISHDKYGQLSEKNRIRKVWIPAPRGLLFDRYMRPLVANSPSYVVTMERMSQDKQREVFLKLNELLNWDIKLLEDAVLNSNTPSYLPIKLKENVDLKTVVILEEHNLELPGITVEVEARRSYLQGKTATHILGYIRGITKEELENPQYSDYRLGEEIGKMGVEKEYEGFLRGEPGGQVLEVNTHNRILRVLSTKDPTPGNNIILTIDAEIQTIVEEALGDKIATVVVEDPRTGEILALASEPSFDPNIFNDRISAEDWEALHNDPNFPMVNRALSGYPAGSLFKIVTAYAALEEGKTYIDISPEGEIRRGRVINCPGSFYLGKWKYDCWKPGGHGSLNIVQAIEQSCNVHFYTLGYEVGVKKLAHYAKQLGLGKETGIDLPNEMSGIIPTPEWKKKTWDTAWFPGDTVNMSIGQGFVMATPLQMANVMSAIANGGTLYKPQIVKKITSPTGEVLRDFKPQIIRKLSFSPDTIRAIRLGLYLAVFGTRGTARRIRMEELPIAGKTGTAQNPHGDNHAWFIAYAPYDNPQVVISVLVEHGGEGSYTAVPIAKEILRRIFDLPSEGDRLASK